jgi:hypothetical protein
MTATRLRPANHALSSGAHAPLRSPSGFVVAVNPEAAAVSASFSPAQISTQASSGALISSGNR